MNMKWVRSASLLGLLVVLMLLVGSAGAASQEDALVKLSTSQTKFTASQDVIITVTITNPTGQSLRLLKWFTPINGLEEPVFTVQRNGETVQYVGAVYKRPAPASSDYILLKAGESITYTVSLGEYYDLSITGKYEISYSISSIALYSDKSGNNSWGKLGSEAIFLKIEGRLPKGKPTPPPAPPPGGTAFNACTADQQAKLTTARSNATTYASSAWDYLQNHKSGTSRYTTWFGEYLISRHTTVTTHFSSLTDAWTNAGVTFDCKCKQNYYAYVYPTRPYTIYLCKVFWLAPSTGTDSQAGTLIHEMSHFYNVANTDDFVYGQTGAKALAISNPDDAINNADNHEYFAENSPALP